METQNNQHSTENRAHEPRQGDDQPERRASGNRFDTNTGGGTHDADGGNDELNDG